MKITLTLEDTTTGVALDSKVSFNGVQDGIERSLAAHIVAQIEHHLAKLQRLHALRVTGEDIPAPRR